MMSEVDFLGAAVAVANRNNSPAKGDYIDSEGFLCCGKCHTRKQTVVALPDIFKVGIPCDCRKKEIERREEELRRAKEMEAVAELKK